MLFLRAIQGQFRGDRVAAKGVIKLAAGGVSR